MCRARAEVCARTTDCCQGLLCDATNHCAPPVQMCAANGSPCQAGAANGNCCTGLGCFAGVCATPPVCGNNACEPGETSDSCCDDCACPSQRQYCSTSTLKCVEATESLRWTLTDKCRDFEDSYFNLFDGTHGAIWPNAAEVYIVSEGTIRFADIWCVKGSEICFGAENNSATYSWGVGLYNTDSCASCCVTCGAVAEVDDVLTCD